MSNEKIQFLEYQKPGLEAGDYELRITQEIKPKEEGSVDRFGSNPLNFSVRGERFSLDPAVVHAVFPPQGSLGKQGLEDDVSLWFRVTFQIFRKIADERLRVIDELDPGRT